MPLINWVLLSIASAVTLYIQVLTYAQLTNKEIIKINLVNIIIFIIAGIFVTYNTYTNINLLRPLASYSLLITIEFILFKDSFVNTIVRGSLCYIIAIFVEIFVGVILILLKLEAIDSNLLFKILLSIFIVLIPYLLLKIKAINLKVKKILTLLTRPFISATIVLIIVLFTLNLAFKYFNNIELGTYISNIFICVTFLIILFTLIYKEYKVNKEVEKTKVLLDFMASYERKIDEDSINRHEMLNNLLILKSYKNKNSKEYNDTLNDFIDLYNRKSVGIKNIHKLPSGLKGIIYFKINEVKNKNIIVNINISKQLSSEIETLDNKTYATICKIIGITFDNAIEAAVNSEEKLLSFDVYNEDDKIVIGIENSYRGKIDINKINSKHYSTKGKKRGLGLYIVKKLIKNNSNIDMIQEIDNKIFITKIYINKKSR